MERLKGEVLAAIAAEYQRLAVDRARRQAIHRAAAAGGHGAPGQCQTHAEPSLGAPQTGGGGSSGNGPHFVPVPLTEAEVLQQLDQHQLWHSSQAFARQVLAEIRWVLMWR